MKLPKKIYIVFSCVTLLLFCLQGFKKNGYPFGSSELFSIGYYSVLIWFYLTGILMIKKSFCFFKSENRAITLGIIFLLAGLTILILAHYIVGIIFIFVYGTG
jgi:hypothetical protein